MKFGTMTQFGSLDPFSLKLKKKFEINDGCRRHLKKSNILHISATIRPIATKFGILTEFDLDLPTP